MKKLYTSLFVLIFIISSQFIFSQPCNIPPAQLNCEDVEPNFAVLCDIMDLDGYCTTLPDFPNPTGQDPLCSNGGNPDNTIWFGFIAGTSTMSITVIPENCDKIGGIQTGIYQAPCPPQGTEIVCDITCSSNPINLTSSNFIPGNIYFFWIDGCAGAVCDITIDVIQGGPLVMGNIGPILGPKKVCKGGTFTYSSATVAGADYYHWTLDGLELSDPLTEDEQISITFDEAGIFKLCLDVSNFCVDVGSPPVQKCIDVTVSDIIPVNPPIAYVCPGNNFNYNGDDYGPGIYEITYESWQKCDSIITLSVEELPESTTDLGIIYKCKQDCITIEDSYGNGGVFCDDAEFEDVYLKTWKACDSIVTYTLRKINLDVKIEKPYDIGCFIDQTPLDGTPTLDNLENYDDLIIKWEAFNGGKLDGPANELNTTSSTGGKYCLTVTATAPNGLICKDSACVVVKFDPNSPQAIIKGDTLSCIKDTINLIGSSTDSTVTYSWLVPGGGIKTNDTITAWVPGTYTLTITAPNLCSNSKTFDLVAQKAGPDVQANGDTISCNYPAKVLTGNSTTPNVSFKWLDGSNKVISNSNTATVSIPGNYSFVVSNNKTGCDSTKIVSVFGDFLPPQNVSAVGDTFNCIKKTATVSAITTSTPVTYLWKGPNGFTSIAQSQIAPNAGLYYVVIKAVNGCEDTAYAEIKADTISPSLQTVNDTIDCFSYSATLSTSTNGSNPTYLWSPGGAVTSSITVNTAGLYNITVTDGNNGCKKSGTAEALNDPNKPKALIVKQPNLITCDSLAVTLYGGSSLNLPNIKYSWSFNGGAPFANTKNTLAPEIGTYQLLVENTANGCSDSISVVVDQNIIVPNISAQGDTTDCVSGQATLQGFSTTPNAQFTWKNPSGVAVGNTKDVTVNGPGTFTVIVRDPLNGCKDSTTAESVPDADAPDVTISKSDDLDCIVTSVTLTAISDPSYTYAWSPGIFLGTSQITVSSPNPTYTVVVTNPINQCKTTMSIAVSQDITPPEISATTDTIKCNNKTATIDGTSDINSNVTISWTDLNSNQVSSTLDFTTTVAQLLTLTVTNNINGCSETLTLNVPENITVPDISAIGENLDCIDQIVTISGSSKTSNVTFLWTGPGGYNASTANATGIDEPGTYNLTIIDKVNGCTNTQQVTVTQDTVKPDLTATGGTLNCKNNSQITLTSNSTASGVVYDWSGPSGFSSSQQNPVAFDPGTYTIEVTNNINGCTKKTTVEVLSDEEVPDLTVNNATIDCINTQQTLNAVSNTPGVTYQWSGQGVNDTSPSIIVTDPGNYVIVVTAANGCTESKTSVVDLNAVFPIATASANGEIDCTNKSVDISSAGSSTGPEYTYNWTGPNGFASSSTNLVTTEPGEYFITITNTTNGCKKDTSVIVPENINLPTGLTITDRSPKCFDAADGLISVTDVMGGTPPYLYSINGKAFSSQNQFNFLTEGTYKISIQDAAGCEFETLLTLTQPEKLTVDVGKDSIIKWGTPIQLYANVSNPKFLESITWSPQLDTNLCSGLGCLQQNVTLFDAQLFTVTVKDSNGCVASDKVLILVKKERPIYIPNVFSPNGDGINDLFFINSGDGIDEITYFQIYDRWGNKIFEKEQFQPNDPKYGWNGEFRGKKVNNAVFVYWALIKFRDGESILYKGDVTVDR